MTTKTLSVLSYNFGLLSYQLAGLKIWEPAPHVEERYDGVAEALEEIDPDVVLGQEIFRAKHCHGLEARRAGRYDISRYDGRHCLQLNSGLIVLSKEPIMASRFFPFRDGPLDERFFFRKGALAVLIDSKEFGRIGLVNFHATVGGLFRHSGAKAAERYRARQIEQVVTIAARLSISADCVLVGGDLNAGPQTSPRNYWQFWDHGFIDTFNEVEHGDEPRITWDPNNSLNVRGPHRECPPQRCDHVFLHASSRRAYRIIESKVVLNEECVALPNRKWVTVSDHYGLLTKLQRVTGPA